MKLVLQQLQKEKNPCLISIHCAAHRLILESSQAAGKINVIIQYRKTLSVIYSQFAVHTENLAVIQQVLEEPQIRMKKF